MATVLALRINEQQALLVADESTWHLGHIFGYRRTNYGDSLASLFDDDETERTGISAVYAGVGFPSFHGEVVSRIRRSLKGSAGRDAGDEDGANRWVARTVYDCFRQSHERNVEDRLRFCYGFGRDALNSRRYDKDGKELTIGMEPIVAAGRAIASGRSPGNAYARMFANGSFVVTHDRVNGVQGYYVNPRGHSIGFATPLATLGEGGSVASSILAAYLERRDLVTRRAGFTLREGLYLGLRIATAVRFGTGKMGGYFQIMLLDGERGVREYVGDETQCAAEVMRAHEWGFIGRGDAEELVCALLLDGETVDTVEGALFERATDGTMLERYLLGFKPIHAPAARNTDWLEEGGAQ